MALRDSDRLILDCLTMATHPDGMTAEILWEASISWAAVYDLSYRGLVRVTESDKGNRFAATAAGRAALASPGLASPAAVSAFLDLVGV